MAKTGRTHPVTGLPYLSVIYPALSVQEPRCQRALSVVYDRFRPFDGLLWRSVNDQKHVTQITLLNESP